MPKTLINVDFMAWQDQGDDEDCEVPRRISFTEESAACSAFPHQVHGPGQGPRAGECPRVHASILGVEAATAGAKMSGTQKEEKRGYQRKPEEEEEGGKSKRGIGSNTNN